MTICHIGIILCLYVDCCISKFGKRVHPEGRCGVWIPRPDPFIPNNLYFIKILIMRIYLLALITVAATFGACQKNNDPQLNITSTDQSVLIPQSGETGSIMFDPNGENITLTVSSNHCDWSYTTDAKWCEVIKKNNELTLRAAPNYSRRSLTGELIVYCGPRENRIEIAFALKQKGEQAVGLSLSSESELVEINNDKISGNILFLAAGGTAVIDVQTTEDDWDAFSSNEGWCTVRKDGDHLTVTAAENITVYDRNSTITVRAGDSKNYAVAKITAKQVGNGNDMIFDVYVHDGAGGTGNHLILPLDHTTSGALVNCVVDWGDGSPPERFVTGYPDHQYANSGRYDVSVTGTVRAILSNYVTYFPTQYRSVIKGIKQWGRIGLQSLKYGFYYFDGLEYIADPGPESFSELLTLYACFEGCVNLKNIPEGMFENAPELIEGYSVFSGCVSIEKIPDRVFAGCSKTERFSFVFKNLKSAKTIGKDIFKGCTASTSYLQSFYQTAIEEIPADVFADAVACKDYSNAFAYCTALKEIPTDLFAESPLVTNFSNVFKGCTQLTAIPADLFVKNTLVTNFNSAFKGCTALTAIPTSLFDSNTQVTNFGKTFEGCTSLGGESPYTINADNQKIHLYERSEPDFKIPVKMGGCFKDCTGLTDYGMMETNYSEWIE